MTDSDRGPQKAPQNTSNGDSAAVDRDLVSQLGDATKPAQAVFAPSTQQLLMFLGVLVVVGIAYYGSILDLMEVWEINPNYSHGYVVPFFALGLGWVAYTRTNMLPLSNDVSRGETVRGGIEIAIGFAFHLVGKITMLDIFDVVGLIFILLGILLAFGGTKANRAYALPVFFLIFMAPLPAPVYDPIAGVLQNFAAIVSVALFDAFGILAERSGIIITLPDGDQTHVMKVAGACSGLRSLTAILALAVAIAYLSGRKMAYCTLLILMAAPVAIAVNCFRIFGTGLIMLYVGPEWATGEAHETEGMIMVGVAAAILALIAWMMAGIEDWHQERTAGDDAAPASMKPALESS